MKIFNNIIWHAPSKLGNLGKVENDILTCGEKGALVKKRLKNKNLIGIRAE